MKSPENNNQDMITKLAVLENIQNTSMEQNNKDHADLKSMILSLGHKLDESLERMENKFAAKWAEKVLVWAGACFGVVFIGLLVRWIVLLEF